MRARVVRIREGSDHTAAGKRIPEGSLVVFTLVAIAALVIITFLASRSMIF